MNTINTGLQAHEAHNTEIHEISTKTKQENSLINRYALQRCKDVAKICPRVASTQFKTSPKVAQMIAGLSDIQIDRLADMTIPLLSLQITESMIEDALSLDVQKRFSALAALID